MATKTKKLHVIGVAFVPPMVRKSNQIHRRFEAFVSTIICHFGNPILIYFKSEGEQMKRSSISCYSFWEP